MGHEYEILELTESNLEWFQKRWLKCIEATNKWLDGEKSYREASYREAKSAQLALAARCRDLHKDHGSLFYNKITNFGWKHRGVLMENVKVGDSFWVEYAMSVVYLYVFKNDDICKKNELVAILIPDK